MKGRGALHMTAESWAYSVITFLPPTYVVKYTQQLLSVDLCWMLALIIIIIKDHVFEQQLLVVSKLLQS